MHLRNRRQFLFEVGRGAIAVSLGGRVARDLVASPWWAPQEPARLQFGPLEPLVDLLLDTPQDQLQKALVGKLRSGTSLRDLVTAGALANARTFGGEDYIGFHTMMALGPAWHMSALLPTAQQPLPVLKVLYRNSNRMRDHGGRTNEVLREAPAAAPSEHAPVEALRTAARAGDLAAAEQAFAAAMRGGPQAGFDALMGEVQDMVEVHRANLPWRAWDLLAVIGQQHAHTLLRQSVHYCVRNERNSKAPRIEVRTLLPKLFAQHKLDEKTLGTRKVDDAWIDRTSEHIFREGPTVAAETAAAALAEGIDPACVGEAVVLAANQILLRDPGRTEREAQGGLRIGSVHGASAGLHACDSANAWCGMARAGNAHNTFASLILGAFQAAADRAESGRDLLASEPWPRRAEVERLAGKDAAELLRATEAAIRSNDQAAACAAAASYGDAGHEPRAMFDLLLRYALSEDGALHAEKYFRTAVDEFESARPAFRWRHVCALARVTASEFGQAAPGQEEARTLLQS